MAQCLHVEHSHLLALTFLRGGLRKAAVLPHILCCVYLSNLARNGSFHTILQLISVYSRPHPRTHTGMEVREFCIPETKFICNKVESAAPVAGLAFLTSEKDGYNLLFSIWLFKAD